MITVYNENRDCHLMIQGRAATNFWSRGRGLIGASPLRDGEGLLIEPCNSVHCFFMSFPIDILYLDKENRVVAIDPAMRPWKVGKIYWKAHAVIELPAGTLERTGTAVGDRLSIQTL
ncbi:MAG: DUF192 domain-containing protein [Caldilineaceae bacterium]|nr:DUF192 domain-containing protein [Caldilineaceae bacterium]HRJ45016.1 DUF192 domain-containing protein [Caldilineaceae bacterium]